MLKQIICYAGGPSMGLSLGLTQDVFAFASQLQQKYTNVGFNTALVTLDGAPATTFSGLELPADYALADAPAPDIVLLHSLWGDIAPLLEAQTALWPHLHAWHTQGVPILAASTASFLLAEAGLLDDRHCTTHWHRHAEMQQRYPRVNLRADRFITATGELYCSAGMNATLEIMVHLLKRHVGEAVGTLVEQTFLTDFRSAYHGELLHSNQYADHQDERILALQQWLDIHFHHNLSLDSLAQRCNMSLRSFKRRFKAATGESPLQYIQQLRLAQAEEHLKHGDLKIAEIAWRVGYEDAGHFTRLFQRTRGCSPAKWRRDWQHGQAATN